MLAGVDAGRRTGVLPHGGWRTRWAAGVVREGNNKTNGSKIGGWIYNR
jgi:hypothetical protein